MRRFLHTLSVKLRDNGPKLHAVIKGDGSHGVLCIPGALGTAVTDFSPQLNHFGDLQSGFTAISFDPRGYGQSIPPRRIFKTSPLHFLEQDAIDGHNLMLEVGFTKYSVLGWSDGGVAAIHLASKYPDSVRKLVIWGANSFVSKEDIELFEKTRNIDNWSKKMRESLEAVYGNDLGPLWSNWVDSMLEVYKRDGILCKGQLSSLKIPTLILHGEKDPMVPDFHPKYLQDHINGSVLYSFPEGRHNIHLRFSEQFNSIVKQFLMS